MSNQEILDQIAKFEKGLSNPNIPESTKNTIKTKIDGLKAQLEKVEEKVENKEEKLQAEEKKIQSELEENIVKWEKGLNNPNIPASAKEAIKKKIAAAKEEVSKQKAEIKVDEKEANNEKKEVKAAVKKLAEVAKKAGKVKGKKIPKVVVKEEQREKKSEKRQSKLKGMMDELQKLIHKNKFLASKYEGKGVDLKRDAARPAKPFGYRFTGKDNFAVPTKEQIKKGLKDGTVDYEGRANRSDKGPKKEYKLAHGGDVDVNQNAEMVLSKAKELHHHATELENVVKPNSDVEAWEVAKMERAATDASDVTHYEDGKKMYMAKGGYMADGGMMAKGGFNPMKNSYLLYEGQSILLKTVPSPKESRFLDKEIVIEKIDNNKIIKAFVRETGEKVPFFIDTNLFKIEQYAHGGMMAKGGKVLKGKKDSRGTFGTFVIQIRENGILRKEEIVKGGYKNLVKEMAEEEAKSYKNAEIKVRKVMAKGGRIGDYKIGEIVKVSRNNDNDNYDDFREKKLRIVDKITKYDNNPAFDESLEDQALYSFEDVETEESIPFSLYDYELERYKMAKGGYMAKGGIIAKYEDKIGIIEYKLNKGVLYEVLDGEEYEISRGVKSKEEAVSYLKKLAKEEGDSAKMKYFAEGGSVKRPYKLGDRWRDDFDYEGMLKQGLKSNVSWGEAKLKKLFNSYEDVNYHTASAPLWDAIQSLKNSKKEEAERQIEEFHKRVKAEMDDIDFTMKKGGNLSSKAKYIPKRDIEEVEIDKNGKEVELDGADLLDGIYVKKSSYTKKKSAGRPAKKATGGEVKPKSNRKGGKSVGQIAALAKQIRKEGEKWTDAIKRASAQLKSKI
jgi:hypothetical protein